MTEDDQLDLLQKIMIGIVLWVCLCATVVIGVHTYLALKNEGVNKVQFSIPPSTLKKK
jgi:alkylhydroperoxidase/carboxymuconolactone decarboxylase family protein YurZ